MTSGHLGNYTSLTDVTLTSVSATGSDTLLQFTDGSSIQLVGVAATAFDTSWII